MHFCEAFTTPTKVARITRSAEDMARRTFLENVADFSDHQKHSIRVPENEKGTLTEELVHQNELRMSNSPNAVKMGKLYYDHQRSLYQFEKSSIEKLRTIDNAQPDIPGLSATVAPACKVPKNFDLIIQWMRRDQLINHQALVHIMQASLRNPAILGLTQQIYAMELFKCIARNDLHKTYPDEWSICKQHFDHALKLSYAQKQRMMLLDANMVASH